MTLYLHTYPVLYSMTFDNPIRPKCSDNEHGMLIIESDDSGFTQVFLLNRSTELLGLSPRGLNPEEYGCNSWCIVYDKQRMREQPLVYSDCVRTVRIEPLSPGCMLANNIRGEFNMIPTKIIKEYP